MRTSDGDFWIFMILFAYFQVHAGSRLISLCHQSDIDQNILNPQTLTGRMVHQITMFPADCSSACFNPVRGGSDHEFISLLCWFSFFNQTIPEKVHLWCVGVLLPCESDLSSLMLFVRSHGPAAAVLLFKFSIMLTSVFTTCSSIWTKTGCTSLTSSYKEIICN